MGGGKDRPNSLYSYFTLWIPQGHCAWVESEASSPQELRTQSGQNCGELELVCRPLPRWA